MQLQHFILAIFIAAAWGMNFIFVRLSLHDIPPLLLCALRFFFSSIPCIFFIKKPNLSLKWLMLYGFFAFGLQFSLLFMGMHAGTSVGLASLLTQSQVFFSLLIAALFLNEKLNIWHIVGAMVAFFGIGIVFFHLNNHASIIGSILVILAALAVAISNFMAKKFGPINGIALVVWGSFVACPLLFIGSYFFEGSEQMAYSFSHLSRLTIASILYIVVISTLFGYGAWNWLLTRYPLATIAPFTLLTPVFGILSASLLFDEPMEPWKKIATICIMTGLCINSLGPKLHPTRLRQKISAILRTILA